MAIVRTYACDDCLHQWTEWHAHSSDPFPPCPECKRQAETVIPISFARSMGRGKAMDITQDILEKDYGMTNYKDNLREGDVGAIIPDTSKADAALAERFKYEAQQAAENSKKAPATAGSSFWAPGGNQMAEMMAANAKVATQAANAEGVNPMKMLHDAGKAGNMKMKMNIIARA